MRRFRHRLVWTVPLLLAAGPIHAHPLQGAADGFVGGLLHPLLGFDHLLALLAVGVWATQLAGAALWKLPLAFLAALIAGLVVAWFGIALPMVEPVIMATLVALGLAICLQTRVALGTASLLVAVLALFHGHAHGAELSIGAPVLSYIAGIVLSSALLQGVGVLATLRLRRSCHSPVCPDHR